VDTATVEATEGGLMSESSTLRSVRGLVPDGSPIIFLGEASTPTERRLLERWIDEHRPAAAATVELITIPHPQHDAVLSVGDLHVRLSRDDDPVLAPLRVAWLPRERNGERVARLADLLAWRDPRSPRPRRQQQIVRREPDRALVLVGEPARKSELAERWKQVSGKGPERGRDFALYIARQAVITLERAEAHAIDERYKLPRLVKDEILASARFQQGVARLASELGRDEAAVTQEVEGYLDEMVTGRSRMLIDLIVRLGRLFYRQGYEGIECDPAQLERVRAAARRHGVVVLPTHRSNLDALVMPVVLYESHLPRTHTLAGINMAFWPVGPLSRRAGVIFIRRDTKDNPVYRWTLREYVGFLVEKRFGLQWYPEGTRSRTGKLLPPKLGLLVYVVDAYLDGRVDDVVLAPASIAYDQLQEVSEFVHEAIGGSKKPEGIGWAVDYWRKLRGRYGKIYVRFAEPMSLRDTLGPPQPMEGDRLQLHKLAFEVMWRINQVTPITGTALLTLVLLSTQGRALTIDLIEDFLAGFLGQAHRRQLPMTSSAEALSTKEGIRASLDALISNKVVTCFDQGPDTVYGIGSDQHLSAAFYRNSIIHFFVPGSIAEMALALTAEDGVEDRLDRFWDEVLHLRDLLKFDFYFAEKDEHQALTAAGLAVHDVDWQDKVLKGPEHIRQLLESFHPLTAPTVLRSFLEAYFVVAKALEDLGPSAELDERRFLSSCLALGRQYLLQGRVRSPDAVSKPLFRNGLELARNRQLVSPAPDITDRRHAFTVELHDVLRRVDAVEVIALQQFLAMRAARQA
jgi:glycerol-3-phosphate O-acyltransferase